MFKKPTKKQFLIRRILLSVLGAFSVVTIVTVTILSMLGFRLDSGNGRLEQGALLQFDSNPSGASVSIDGNNIGVKTAGKQTVVAGIHTISMKKDKYEDWSRTIDLAAGTLTWLDYARLVPKERTPEVITTQAQLAGAKFSPDLKWGALQEKADVPAFKLLDLRSQEVKMTDVVVPDTMYSDAGVENIAHAFTMIRWNADGRHMLVEHTYNDAREWLLVDTQDIAKTTNITRLLGVNFTDLQFASSNGTTLYGLGVDGTVRKLDLPAGTISRTLITKVKSFTVFNNTLISYTGVSDSTPEVNVAGVYRDGDDAGRVLKSAANLETTLFIDATRYFSDDYVVIGENEVVTVFKGSIPTSSAQDTSSLKRVARFSMDAPLTALSFSPRGGSLLAQAGTSYKNYELEHKRLTNGALVAASGTSAPKLEWLDSSHLVTRDAGALVMRDFDGANAYTIMSVAPQFGVTLSQNGKFFYGIGQAEDGSYTFQRVKMIVD